MREKTCTTITALAVLIRPMNNSNSALFLTKIASFVMVVISISHYDAHKRRGMTKEKHYLCRFDLLTTQTVDLCMFFL